MDKISLLQSLSYMQACACMLMCKHTHMHAGVHKLSLLWAHSLFTFAYLDTDGRPGDCSKSAGICIIKLLRLKWGEKRPMLMVEGLPFTDVSETFVCSTSNGSKHRHTNIKSKRHLSIGQHPHYSTQWMTNSILETCLQNISIHSKGRETPTV